MEIQDTLKDIGLADEEIKIYITLLKEGQILASKVAEQTKINRSHTYQLLERLISKGFVGYVIKENRKYFSAVNPEKIIEIIKEKESKLKNIIPQLLNLVSIQKDKPLVEIFQGREGIKTILNDILKTKNEWLAFGSSGKGAEALPFFAEHWEKKRAELKISLRGILDVSVSGKKRGKELSKRAYTQVKYMDEEYSNPASTWIYGDKMALVIWDNDNSFAIRILSKEIANNFKKHFENLWKIAKR